MELTISATTEAFKPNEGVRVEYSQTAKFQAKRAETNVEKVSVEKAPDKVQIRDLEQAADRLNQALQAFDRDLAISILDDGKVVVRVTDPATGDVVRQIPPERVLEVEEHLDKIVGLFVNDQA